MSESRIKERRFRYRVTHSRLAAWRRGVLDRVFACTRHSTRDSSSAIECQSVGLGCFSLVRTDTRDPTIRSRSSWRCARETDTRRTLRHHLSDRALSGPDAADKPSRPTTMQGLRPSAPLHPTSGPRVYSWIWMYFIYARRSSGRDSKIPG